MLALLKSDMCLNTHKKNTFRRLRDSDTVNTLVPRGQGLVSTQFQWNWRVISATLCFSVFTGKKRWDSKISAAGNLFSCLHVNKNKRTHKKPTPSFSKTHPNPVAYLHSSKRSFCMNLAFIMHYKNLYTVI